MTAKCKNISTLNAIKQYTNENIIQFLYFLPTYINFENIMFLLLIMLYYD